MSAFTNGFKHGFMHGMFNNMFGGGWCSPFMNSYGMGFNPFAGYCNPFNNFGFGCNPYMSWNPASMFMTPSYRFNNFALYQSPSMSMPSLWNVSVPDFSVAPAWSNLNYAMPVFTIPSFTSPSPSSDTYVKTDESSVSTVTSKNEKAELEEKNEKKSAVNRTSGSNSDFDAMLKFVLAVEGGYNPNDCGQAGNKGVLQSTYDSYRKQKGLSTRHVKNITDDEVKDLYYTMFYKESGADKISDPKLALYVFDTAVNMGVSRAKEILKQSGNDCEKFEKIRLNKYEAIAASKPEKAKYLKGWKNRVAKAEDYANKEFIA